MPDARASSTASELGADTAATTSISHASAFCTISNYTRPETISTRPHRSARAAAPSTLSTAL